MIVVHGDEPNLIEPYQRLASRGFRVERAPNFRRWRGIDYAARNSAGTLLYAPTDADYLVLCDPDMVVVAPWNLDRFALEPSQISFDWLSYLDPAEPDSAHVRAACAKLGFTPNQLLAPNSRGGVPHIIPTPLARPLARAWLDSIDALVDSDPKPGRWADPTEAWGSLASMWALAIAAARLGITCVETYFCDFNAAGLQPWPNPLRPEASIIHYCYGDHVFDKRSIDPLRAGARLPAAIPATVGGRVIDCIAAACRAFGYERAGMKEGRAACDRPPHAQE